MFEIQPGDPCHVVLAVAGLSFLFSLVCGSSREASSSQAIKAKEKEARAKWCLIPFSIVKAVLGFPVGKYVLIVTDIHALDECNKRIIRAETWKGV